jgi:hypothetical protein
MTNRISGYDPETGICWMFRNKGDREIRCKCSAHSSRYGEKQRTLAFFGRCRSGSCWFWAAHTLSFDDENKEAFGWADTEELATAAAMAAVRSFREGLPILADVSHGCASRKLKKLNAAKRATRPSSGAKDSRVVEYLYGTHGRNEDRSPIRFQITKKTPKRVFYIREGEWLDRSGVLQRYPDGRPITTNHGDGCIGYVNRQKLETDGSVYNDGVHWSASDHHLYASFEGLMANCFRRDPEPADLRAQLRKLKAEMAAAHPDRGGSNAAFIEARARYIAARRTRQMA